MKIGIHGKKKIKDHIELIRHILEFLGNKHSEIFFSDGYYQLLDKNGLINKEYNILTPDKIDGLDLIMTLGGDGTLLEGVTQVNQYDIPILGINVGRMGFLATTAKENVEEALDQVFNKEYTIDERTLLKLKSNENIFEEFPYALNDFTIVKKDSSSMISVKVYINDEFVNTYWADGIIVSTPTGSTGYSLSCGGPLILPGSRNFVLTPVSPHNLTARPMVVPDDCKVSFKIEGRGKSFLCSLDSRFATISSSTELSIEKAEFSTRLIKLPENSYFKTIRQKLMWGIDYRN